MEITATLEKPFGIEDPFDELLLEAVDETLSLLGERVKGTFYLYLSSRVNMSKQQIPGRIDDFALELERVFGVGARHLEFCVIKRLQNRINFVFPVSLEKSSLREGLEALKRKYKTCGDAPSVLT